MKYAKFFSIFVAVFFALYGLIGFYFLPLASFDGSLTRMAKLPESYFGWTREQPAINPELMKSADWQEADVLAIGDSFTHAQIWQTVLTERGVRVRTETWGSIFNICEDIEAWIRSKGFKGKYVIIESAEMYFEDRLAHSVSCKQMNYHPLAIRFPPPPKTLRDRNGNDYSGRLSVGIQTKLNSIYYEQLRNQTGFISWDSLGDARLHRVTDGCNLFSHPSCSDVLFYEKDRILDLGDNILQNMSVINDRLSGYTTVWVVIPDKGTVYLRPEKKFWDVAEQRFIAPNVLRAFRQSIENKTIDLYLGNDTHVSTTGYLLLGKVIYQSIYR